jgi:L-seryl-tRNA(Ser) seleniumtransferase
MRALRCDKLQLAVLASALQKYLVPSESESANPTRQLFERKTDTMRNMAHRILSSPALDTTVQAEIVDARGKVGSGAYPVAHINSVALKITSSRLNAEKLARLLRLNPTPIFGYIENDTCLLNMLTIFEEDIDEIVSALNRIK